MNQEIKKLWVEALRSGKYAQGTDMLRDSADRFCCLGVLCDLAVNAKVADVMFTESGPEIEGPCYVYNGNDIGLTEPVRRWADLSETFFIQHDGRPQTLIDLNDDVKLPFPKIADLIEEQL